MFADRVEAGRLLATQLLHLRADNVVVLGLPRGGVAFEVAQVLAAPLDVVVVRKLGVPSQPEVAMGAIGEGGERVLDTEVLARTRITSEQLDAVETRERVQLDAKVDRLRQGHRRTELAGRTVVLVDDGIATGSTASVACEVVRRLGAARVDLAVPVALAEALRKLAAQVEVVCVEVPEHFTAVGYHYGNFSPTSDEDVLRLLSAAHARWSSRRSGGETP